MKPRASAPSTRSGFFPLTHSARSPTACLSAPASARSGVMSLKSTPGVGKSGTSRIFVRRSMLKTRALSLRQVSQVAPEEQRRELAGELCELLQVLQALSPALVASRTQRGCDELPEQSGLAAGGGAEGAQVPRRDA